MQMHKSYDQLSKDEQDSDRAEADKFLAVFQAEIARLEKAVEKQRDLKEQLFTSRDKHLERADRLEAEFEKMEAALGRIRNWTEAYPLDMFPEPTKEDWKEIARLLKDNGYLIDSVTSSNMRHVINGVKALVEDVLDRIEGE